MLQNRGLEEARAALGAYQGTLGVSWCIWKVFRGILGASWGVLGVSWAASWGVLGLSWGGPGASHGVLGRLGGALGQIFESEGR